MGLVVPVLEDVVVLYVLRGLADLLEELVVDLLHHYFRFVEFRLKFLLFVNEVVLLQLVFHKKRMVCLVKQQLVLVFLADLDSSAFDLVVNSPRAFSLQPSALLLHLLLPEGFLIHDVEVAVIDEEVVALQELVILVAEEAF